MFRVRHDGGAVRALSCGVLGTGRDVCAPLFRLSVEAIEAVIG
jgi:hypothetical protein